MELAGTDDRDKGTFTLKDENDSEASVINSDDKVWSWRVSWAFQLPVTTHTHTHCSTTGISLMVLQTSLQKQLKTKIPARKHTHTHTGLIPAVSSNSFIHGAVMIASRHFLFRLMEMSAGTTGIHAKRKKKLPRTFFKISQRPCSQIKWSNWFIGICQFTLTEILNICPSFSCFSNTRLQPKVRSWD